MNLTSERQIWFVISVPGLNDWAKKKCKTIVETNAIEPNSSPGPSNKRSIDEIDEPMDCSEPVTKKEKIPDNDSQADTKSNENSTTVPSVVSKEHILNFPIPNEDGILCIVKVSCVIFLYF